MHILNGNYKWIINKCLHGHILQQAEKTVNQKLPSLQNDTTGCLPD